MLRGATLAIAGSGTASDYAAGLLAACGGRVRREAGARNVHPDLAWALSGAMALSGQPDGPPEFAPGPLASAARGALWAVGALAGRALGDGAPLLGERAALAGLERRGAISAGGGCRILRARDGFLAVNLARDDDVALLPAWLGPGAARDRWTFARAGVARRNVAQLLERARLLGLPVSATERDAPAPPWLRATACGPAAVPGRDAHPLVVDLSALWAGPLCTHTLASAGARVVKVESTARPDGARRGPRAFFDRLNAGKRCVALDFTRESGRRALRALLGAADVVVESARPRALAQLGIDAEAFVAARPGVTWLSITGYGRRDPEARWVAFGDDAAVAAGAVVGDACAPLFCGDAIADPLTGLHAAVAALASWRAGGGHLLDLALRDVTAHAAAFPAPTARARVIRDAEGWRVEADGRSARVRAPFARPAAGRSRALGADTRGVLSELGVAC